MGQYTRKGERGHKEPLAKILGFTANKSGAIFDKEGKPAKCYLGTGDYLLFKAYRVVSAHRYVWFHFNGPIPNDKVIDHINRNRTDNRLENLRCVSHSENMKNRAPYYRNNRLYTPKINRRESDG